jgi:predicted ribosomally synthesized peptide with SipW-like signal peptide
MNKQHKIIATIGAGVAGLALIGAGAGATFTDSVNAQQQITAGRLSMTVAGPDGSSTDGKTVTLAPVGPTQSTFSTGQQLITTTNSGDITASAIRLSLDASNNSNAALLDQVYVKIESWSAPNQGGTLSTAYDGPLSGLAGHPMAIMGDVPAGSTDPFYVTFYAGSGAAPSLTNAVMGSYVVPRVTVSYDG